MTSQHPPWHRIQKRWHRNCSGRGTRQLSRAPSTLKACSATAFIMQKVKGHASPSPKAFCFGLGRGFFLGSGSSSSFFRFVLPRFLRRVRKSSCSRRWVKLTSAQRGSNNLENGLSPSKAPRYWEDGAAPTLTLAAGSPKRAPPPDASCLCLPPIDPVA